MDKSAAMLKIENGPLFRRGKDFAAKLKKIKNDEQCYGYRKNQGER
jgi:hypothetical protein